MSLDFCDQKGKRLVITTKQKTSLIDIESIVYLECEGYITSIHFDDQKSIYVSKLLKIFEQELNSFGFIRVNNNTIVNSKFISEIITSLGKKYILVNNSKIKISRRRRFIIKELLKG